MRTKFFLSLLALGAMVTFFVSCENEEPFVDPGKVIKSEVVDPGTAEDVTEVDNGTEGTSLSYETWIIVDQLFADGSTSKPKTRTSTASSGNKITVVLSNDITNHSSKTDVSDFEIKEAKFDVSYRELGSSRYPTEEFVNVIDSAVVYTVDRGCFALEFVLPYQVAVYDDGITKITMPYHKYSNIKDNGGEVTELDDETTAEGVYKQKMYKHTILAEFNGKEYPVIAEVVLRKEVKEDVLVERKVVESGVELVSYDADAKTGVSKSWIKIEETWSESGVKSYVEEVMLNNSSSDANFRSFAIYVQNKIQFSDLSYGGSSYSDSEGEKRTDGNFSITKYERTYKMPVVCSKEDARSNFYFGVVYEKAIYTNGDLEYEMPCFSYGEAEYSVTQESDWTTNSEGQEEMKIKCTSSVNFDKVKYAYLRDGSIFVQE